MDSTKKAGIVAAIVVVAIVAYWFGRQSVTAPTTDQPTDDLVCAQVITYAHAAGNGEIKEFATPCDVPAGWVSVGSMIQLDNLAHGQAINSPFEITGAAPGPWYFEASFPIELTDADGNQLATAVAQAQGDWMTTDLVPFKATLEFATGGAASGTLKFKNDNPSGEPANDLWYNVLVNFGS